MASRIAIAHATLAAVVPVQEAFARVWPQAETIEFLDDSLSRDLAESGRLTPDIFDRIADLARRGRDSGARAILFSCSAFGPAIEAARASLDIPALKSSEAMFEEALATGRSIRLIATYPPTIPSTREELMKMAARDGHEVEIDACYVPGAFDALLSGQPERHDALIAQAVGTLPPCDVALLTQFSMARAFDAVAETVEYKILSSPESAVRKLRDQFAVEADVSADFNGKP